MALLNGFEALGTEAWMAVATKRTDDPRVVSFYESPHVHYSPDHPIRRARLSARRSLDDRFGLEDFNHPYTRHVTELTGRRPDVLLWNNLRGDISTSAGCPGSPWGCRSSCGSRTAGLSRGTARCRERASGGAPAVAAAPIWPPRRPSSGTPAGSTGSGSAGSSPAPASLWCRRRAGCWIACSDP